MNEAQTALFRRAVACKGWRWMPGMRTSIRVVCYRLKGTRTPTSPTPPRWDACSRWCGRRGATRTSARLETQIPGGGLTL